MKDDALVPYDRFFKLYTFRYLERRTASGLLLQVSIAALRYGAAELAPEPTAHAYARGRRHGADYVRAVVYPRWSALLDAPAPYAPLGLDWDEDLRLRTGWPALARYRERRALDNSLQGYLRSYLDAPPIRIPVGVREQGWRRGEEGKLQRRLAQLQRALETADTALRTVATIAALINDWRAQRKRRELLDVQRKLLQEALSQNLAGASEALRLSEGPEFVAGYLAEHAGDEDDADFSWLS
jgi:hypothetical protein